MTQTEPHLDEKEYRRRRRERTAIFVILLIMAVVTYVEVHSLRMGMGLPFYNSVLFFALININTTLLLLLMFLVVRNLVKLVFERRRKILGSRLRTRLVVAFTSLSLIPTILLFFLSIQFISSSVEHWFNLNVERSLQNSLDLGTEFYQRMKDDAARAGGRMAVRVQEAAGVSDDPRSLEAVMKEELFRSPLSFACLYRPDGRGWFSVGEGHSWFNPGESLPEDFIEASLAGKTPEPLVVSRKEGDWLISLAAVRTKEPRGENLGLLASAALVPAALVEKMELVSNGYESYKQAVLLKSPIKVTHYIILSAVTLIILFFATWYGFYLSRELTDPVRKLAEATNSVAHGNYDVQIEAESRDEIGTLVKSFNQMAQDLKRSRRELDETNRELVRRNMEVEQRRRYMEVVLKNVAAGVISVDSLGRVTTINRSVERMLSVKAERLINREIGEFLSSPYGPLIQQFLDEVRLLKSGTLERQVRIPLGNSMLTLLVKVNLLRDEDDRYMGMVVVLDDLSEIEKAQRISAWREVARRIAHEIKNPLTPIQLCAQRLQKRYGDRFRETGDIFGECTTTIVRQVEELKKLVNEFSAFARMPSVNPTMNQFADLIEETLPLYKESHKEIEFGYHLVHAVPPFNLDREQMKRVFVNLLDNAVAVNGTRERTN
jgi:two-component system nitrogen regulation sensor histidine kinase NtrY